MAKKKGKLGSPPNEHSTPNDRVRWVLASFFGGNRLRMARALGFSHTLVNKIVADEQQPGRQFLSAIIDKLNVAPGWLMTGVGEPVLGKGKEPPTDGWPVPISYVLLPGPLVDNRDLLSGETHLVAGAHFSESVFVFHVQSTEPLSLDPAEAIVSGDRILMDTNPKRWRKNLRVLDGKLCGVRRKTTAGPVVVLARVHCRFDTSGETCQLYASIGSTSTTGVNAEPHGTQVGYHKTPAPVQLDKIQPERPAFEPDESLQPIGIEDIVSVATVLFRFV